MTKRQEEILAISEMEEWEKLSGPKELIKEYSEIEAIAFLEWAYHKGYRRFMVKGDGECHWQRDQKGDLTTGQVYQLFESEYKK